MKPEQQALLQKAQDNIVGAKGLQGMGLYGIAVSRAYYAMFYVVQAFLLQQDLSFSKHSAVVSAFGKHFAKAGLVPQKFHHYLLEAQEERHLGDYDLQYHFTEAEASEQIQRAEEFLLFSQSYFKQIS